MEREAQAFRAADPVLLHQPDLLRPAIQAIECGQEIVRVLRDLEEPLREFPAFDRRARTPAPAVDHLFVGKDGAIDRVPVHIRFGTVDQASLIELDEQPLLMLVVLRIAGRELPRPVDRKSHLFELLAHRSDVRIGPVARIDALFARRIFGR